MMRCKGSTRQVMNAIVHLWNRVNLEVQVMKTTVFYQWTEAVWNMIQEKISLQQCWTVKIFEISVMNGIMSENLTVQEQWIIVESIHRYSDNYVEKRGTY